MNIKLYCSINFFCFIFG